VSQHKIIECPGLKLISKSTVVIENIREIFADDCWLLTADRKTSSPSRAVEAAMLFLKAAGSL
jgi:hypothetical protein